ncbi:MAG TPA: two-component regulator propeller domain-containing protein [Chitinophagaceae bacterium]|nr:two-component regulator propeller domain-containing protein [Chitinophagaceae bacterium]
MRFLILFILIFSTRLLQGQHLMFENYTSENGLSQNSCYAMAQDDLGFMWFGTQDGLNRYDGREFRVYSQNTDFGKKLPSNIITSLFFDGDKKYLWVGTVQGVCLYHPAGDSLVRISELFPWASKLDHLSIKKIISFRPDEYWVITFNNGLINLNTKKTELTTYFNDEENKGNITSIVMHENRILVSLLYTMHEMVPQNSAYQVRPFHPNYPFPQIKELYSYNNQLWIGTMAIGCYYIKTPIDNPDNIVVSKQFFGGVGGFSTDRDNKLWIGTRGSGLYRFDPESGAVTRSLTNQFDPTTPCSNYSLSMFTDRQGIVWCGFSGGIAKYDPLRYQFRNIDDRTSLDGSLSDKVIVRMYKAKDGKTYVGTQNKGIMEWDPAKNYFKRYEGSEIVGTANNVVYDISEDKIGNLWVASCGGLMHVDRKTNGISYYSDKKLPELNKMYAIIKLRKADSLLIATENGLRFFSLTDKKWHRLPDYVRLTTFMGGLYVYTGRYFYEDANNSVWICTEGSGLVRYNYLRKEFESIAPVNKFSLFIRHLLADGPLFWLATDNGLIIYDWQQKKMIKHVPLNTNGSSNVCYAIQKDANNDFWVSSNLGLYKFNRQGEFIQKYNTGNGLSFLEYNTACTLKDSVGSLYFGGMGGITKFDPSGLKHNTYSPPPVITMIKVDNKAWDLNMNPALATELTFNHLQNFITIQFAVNNFSNEANNMFSYRLKGLNNNWTERTVSNVASFTSLPPGNYTFELRSANSDGVCSNSLVQLQISILPPWWQTWWFIALALIVVAALISLAVTSRIRKIRHDAFIKQQLAEMEIKGLHAQMNPHFIFNSLNSIKEMILEDQKQNASRYLSKFAQLIRTSLEQSRQAFITIDQCVDHLKQYLEMEKLRFEDFSYEIRVDEQLDADEIQIAPMLVQPLVENAIWHGLRNKKADRRLMVHFYREGNQVICEIDDNGVGYRHTMNGKTSVLPMHKSLGITNIRERLTLLNEKYHIKCSLSIRDKADLPDKTGSGTVATLQLTI